MASKKTEKKAFIQKTVSSSGEYADVVITVTVVPKSLDPIEAQKLLNYLASESMISIASEDAPVRGDASLCNMKVK